MTNEQMDLIINQIGIAFAIITMCLLTIFVTYIIVDMILTDRAKRKWLAEQDTLVKNIVGSYNAQTWKRKKHDNNTNTKGNK